MSDQQPKPESFDSWCVLELMGHAQICGRVTEQKIGDGMFIRVDVPAQPERKAVQSWDKDEPPIEAYTRFLGASAIYAINPCSESTAKATASRMRVRPPLIYGTTQKSLPGFIDEDHDPDEYPR